MKLRIKYRYATDLPFAIVSISLASDQYEYLLLTEARFYNSALPDLANQAGHELAHSGEFELALSPAEVHA